METTMDPKLKYRILGVALATLVLMLFLPELIKNPDEPAPAELRTELQMPSQPSATLRPPRNTLAFTDTQLDSEPAPGEVIFHNPNRPTDPVLSPQGAADQALGNDGTLRSRPVPQVTPLDATAAQNSQVPQPASQALPGSGTPGTAEGSGTAAPLTPPAGSTIGLVAGTEPASATDANLTSGVTKPPIELVSLKYRPPAQPVTNLDRDAFSPPGPAATPSISPVRTASGDKWSVQAGAFAVKKNASLFADQLRAKQFEASFAAARVDGRNLFVVRLGPYATKWESEKVRERLFREEQLAGLVLPY